MNSKSCSCDIVDLQGIPDDPVEEAPMPPSGQQHQQQPPAQQQAPSEQATAAPSAPSGGGQQGLKAILPLITSFS